MGSRCCKSDPGLKIGEVEIADKSSRKHGGTPIGKD